MEGEGGEVGAGEAAAVGTAAYLVVVVVAAVAFVGLSHNDGGVSYSSSVSTAGFSIFRVIPGSYPKR